MLERQHQQSNLEQKRREGGVVVKRLKLKVGFVTLEQLNDALSHAGLMFFHYRPRRVGRDEKLGGRKRKSSSLGRCILRRMDEGHSAARCKLTLPMRLGRNGLFKATVPCVRQNLPTFEKWVHTPSERREQAEQG